MCNRLFFQDGEFSDPEYGQFRDDEHCSYWKQKIEEYWHSYEPFCGDDSSKFRNEAMANFRGQMWHLYLADVLMQNGLKLIRAKADAPDLCVECGSGRIWIEAVCPKCGTGLDSPSNIDGEAFESGCMIFERIALRLQSSLDAKYKQINRFVEKGFLNPADYCLIAINASELTMASFNIDYSIAFKTLYGINMSQSVLHRDGSIQLLRRSCIQKASGSEVAVGCLSNERYQRINGVLYWPTDIPIMDPEAASKKVEVIPNAMGAGIPEEIRRCFPTGWAVINDMLEKFIPDK